MNWINIEEEMPSGEIWVLVGYKSREDTCYTFAQWDSYHKEWLFFLAPRALIPYSSYEAGAAVDSSGHNCVIFQKNITYWMPVPEIPNATS